MAIGMPQRDEDVGQVGGRPPGAADSRPRRPPPAARRRQPATPSRAGCSGRNGHHFERKAVPPGPACSLAGGRTQRHRNAASARRYRRTCERRHREHLQIGRHPPGCGAVAAVGTRLVLGRWPLPLYAAARWAPAGGLPPPRLRCGRGSRVPAGARGVGVAPTSTVTEADTAASAGEHGKESGPSDAPPKRQSAPPVVVGRGVGGRDQPRRRRRRG